VINRHFINKVVIEPVQVFRAPLDMRDNRDPNQKLWRSNLFPCPRESVTITSVTVTSITSVLHADTNSLLCLSLYTQKHNFEIRPKTD